jgi:hypothetical protein
MAYEVLNHWILLPLYLFEKLLTYSKFLINVQTLYFCIWLMFFCHNTELIKTKSLLKRGNLGPFRRHVKDITN